MANKKILDQKQTVIDEIKAKVNESATAVFFNCSELPVSDLTELRRKLKENGCELKVYKNTLVKRALDSLNFDLNGELNGPKVVAFGNDTILPIKIVNDFAKTHPTLELRIGIVDGEVTGIETLKQLANVPSRDVLLTMLAGGLIGVVKDLSISLDLYSQKLEN